MKTIHIVIASMLACSVTFGLDLALDKQKKQTGSNLPVAEWKLPPALDELGVLDESKLPDSPYGDMVKYGYKLISQTHNYIGPNAKDEAKRYAGNHLSCNSCHAQGGTKQYSAGFIGITARFPQYNARGDKIVSLEDRINGCMQRSMNGKTLPLNSPEMRAIVTYMHYLSVGVPVGANIKGQSLKKVKLLDRPADPAKGKVVYEAHCTVCHGENGEGMKNPEFASADYYIYPPLWGDDSYNTGAGMYRMIKVAQFIKQNMPQFNEILTDEEAFDVAAYINSKPRPIKDGRENDFPNRKVKAIDMDVGPHDDKFSDKQHKYGPFKEMKY